MPRRVGHEETWLLDKACKGFSGHSAQVNDLNGVASKAVKNMASVHLQSFY